MQKMTGEFRIMIRKVNVNETTQGFQEVLQQQMICQSYGNVTWRDVQYVDDDGNSIPQPLKLIK